MNDPSEQLTHSALVDRAARWLRNSKHCPVVLRECGCSFSREVADAIGWSPRGGSILVEAKTSVADFRADRQKRARQYEELGFPGLGAERYFMAPAGVLTSQDMPEGWGLLEVTPKTVRVHTKATPRQPETKAELALLVAELRRIEVRGLTRRNGLWVPNPNQTPGEQ